MISLASEYRRFSAKTGQIDKGVFTATLLLLGLGVVLVYSSSCALAQAKFGDSDFFLIRQGIRALLAVACFMVFINVDYHVWGKMSKGIFIAAIILLILAIVMPENHAIKGARRWIRLGPIQFQASEFARLALVVLLAARLQDAGEQIREWKKLTGYLAIIGAVCALVFLEPNFSTAFIIALIGVSLLFISGANLWHLTGLALALIPVGLAGMISAPYRVRRLMGFFNFSEHKDGIGYQTYQAILGLGNGGIFGKGLGQGEQKFFYLPEPHTDFAFAILGEEIGFIGLALVFAAFCFILYRGMKIALNAPDKMGQLMAFGFTFMIGLYVIVHAAVNTGLMPTTGVPLPLLSYGGMSLAFTMSGIGILLNISSQADREPTRRTVLPTQRGDWKKKRGR